MGSDSIHQQILKDVAENHWRGLIVNGIAGQVAGRGTGLLINLV